MATSPLFGWEEPDDTDLVKDGAAAIRTLGNAIDTSLGDLLGGTTGQVLAKASNTDLDYSWTTISAGGMTLLASGSLSGASVTISSISGLYKNLQLIIRDAIPSTQAGIRMRFNSDTGTNYMNANSSVSGTSKTFDETYLTVSSDIDTTSDTLIVTNIYDYANTVSFKIMDTLAFSQNSGTPNYNLIQNRGAWENTAAITAISLLFYTGNFAGGNYYLYGAN